MIFKQLNYNLTIWKPEEGTDLNTHGKSLNMNFHQVSVDFKSLLNTHGY